MHVGQIREEENPNYLFRFSCYPKSGMQNKISVKYLCKLKLHFMISIKFKVEEAPMKIKGSGWQGDVQNNFIIVSRLQSYYSSTIFLSNISLISPDN